MKYVALLRGINVGGKNKIAMADLKRCLEELGYTNISTYINSGNVLFSSSKNTEQLAKEIESALISKFEFDGKIIKVLVLSKNDLERVIKNAPQNFGSQPDLYYSDVVFLIGIDHSVIDEFELNPEVDTIWEGRGVLYFQRVGALRTKSRLSKIIAKPIYKSMTIRTWGTVQKLWQKMSE